MPPNNIKQEAKLGNKKNSLHVCHSFSDE